MDAKWWGKMSYLRSAWNHKYVKGISEDYIYDNGETIIDYGDITNEGLVEILCGCIDRSFERDEKLIKKYLMKELAGRLDVKLRAKPLNEKTILDRMLRKSKKWNKAVK